MANVDVTRIAGNIGALNALNSLQNINKQLATHQTRLSTGKRINSAADDPAGLTIATKMMARSQGMSVVIDNIGDASNMLSVAESGLSKMNDIMVQMRNKAEQAASDTLGLQSAPRSRPSFLRMLNRSTPLCRKPNGTVPYCWTAR
jgi:flagellin